METDPSIKAQEYAKSLEEEARKKGSRANFSVITETSGTKEGKEYVIKEKPDGETILYPVD